MLLKKLSLLKFKNYDELSVDLSSSVNCFLGNNGEGKTNLLDAIYYLSFCKSYFNPIDIQNIKHNEPFFAIDGIYEQNDSEIKVYCGLKKGQKKIVKFNKKNYERHADHIGIIPLVMISPLDVLLIIEGSEGRRKFIDGIISQYDKSYLEHLLQYNKALVHRNMLLKSFWLNKNFDSDLLDIWNEQLIKNGELIHQARKKFIQDFSPIFQKYYSLLSKNLEVVKLNYESQLNNKDFSLLLKEGLEKDQITHYTNAGIHKDDLEFLISDYPLKKFASQGQQKTFLLALKLAQAEIISEISKKKVIFLLDDIFDKLDENRMKQLLNILGNGNFGQIFITDTSITRIPKILTQENIIYNAFQISNGGITNV
ncbi:MAG: DNA replication and repair protein RecF [Flavobacteriales bacterium]|nr:DNA replication and repair protein RecF [Flavobacteriales bacterium]